MNIYSVAKAVLLGLDTAKGKSGACLVRPQDTGLKLVTHGVVRKQHERDLFVSSAKELAQVFNIPLIIVAEEWDRPKGYGKNKKDKHWNYDTILGIGEGWGKWTAEFERHDISMLDVIRVTPNIWRDALFGRDRPKDSDALKQVAIDYAKRRTGGLELPSDVAEALCIAIWGSHSPEVHARAAVRRRVA